MIRVAGAPNRFRTLVTSAVACAMLNGCTFVKQVTVGDDCDEPSMIPAEQQLCKDNEAFNQTVAGGAAIGALVGAGAAALTCAATHAGKPLACAAIGLGAGLFAGGVAGYVVAKKQEAAKQNVRAIDGVTSDIKEQNANLRNEVAAAQQVAQNGQQQLARIAAQERAGQISAEQARHQREQYAQDSKRLEGVIKERQKQADDFRDAGQQVNQGSRDYSRELSDMQRNVVALQKQKDALDSAIQASG